MKKKSKSVLIVIITLVIGFILGVFSTSQFLHHKREKLFRRSPEKVFKERFIRDFKPSDKQMKLINPILEKYSKRGRTISETFGKEFKLMRDSFNKEIEPVLTESQKKKLKEINEKRRKYWQNRRKNKNVKK